MDVMTIKRGRGRPRKEGSTSKPPVLHPRDPDILMQQGRRPESPDLWEATFTLAGANIGPRSLKTTDWGDACYQAGVMKAELAAAVKTGQPVKKVQHTFSEAAAEMIADYETKMAEAAAEKGWGKTQVWRGHINRLKNTLVPAFGIYQVSAITDAIVAAWVHELRVREVPQDPNSKPKPPTQSTVMNLNNTFRRCMKYAARKGWIAPAAIPRMSKAGFDTADARAAFIQDEVRRLEQAMSPKWIAAGLRAESRELRTIMRAYVAMAACTGIRPGVELDRVVWRHIDMAYLTKSGRRVIRIYVEARQGKHTKPRYVIAYQNPKFRVFDLRKELAALRDIHGGVPDDEAFIFARPGGDVPELSGAFRSLLKETRLLREKGTGKVRVLYSLRHYYGTEQALRGRAVFKLAKMMGTSPAMLERYYLHADTDRMADEMSGADDHRPPSVGGRGMGHATY